MHCSLVSLPLMLVVLEVMKRTEASGMEIVGSKTTRNINIGRPLNTWHCNTCLGEEAYSIITPQLVHFQRTTRGRTLLARLPTNLVSHTVKEMGK